VTIGPEILEPFLCALLNENQQINLTAVRDLAAARILHSLDSLRIQQLSLPPSPQSCLDLGTGNGFPGIALHFIYPQATITLMDRTRKKLVAIERVLATVGIAGIHTIHADAEQAPKQHPELASKFDLVTARAVGDPSKVARMASPLIAPQGHLVLWLDENTSAPAKLTGVELSEVREYELPEPAARRRRLACYRKF
jgi:16S rRNA (guanine527-N7)-methyltransferase